MRDLSTLKDTHRQVKSRRRVGRGTSSGVGKTCRRGQKGAGARSGYKRRHGQEGGQLPLFMRLPTRGFSNAGFAKKPHVINLGQIETLFEDGDLVNVETLRKKGFLSGTVHGLKVLAEGEITKKVKVEAAGVSKEAAKKLEAAGAEVTIRKKEKWKRQRNQEKQS